MALIQYSALVNSMSGKLNGSVASFNKGGSYLRNKGIVTNPNTIAQVGVRFKFGSIAASWRGLSDADRLSWVNLAASTPYTNRFGETKQLSGFGMYQQRNLNLAVIGHANIDAAPVDQGIPVSAVQLAVYDASAGAIFTVTVPTGLGNWVPVLDATPKLSAGVTYIKNKIRLIGSMVVSGTAPNLTFNNNEVTEKFGTIDVGDTIGLGLYYINSVTGQSTAEYLTTVPVIA